MLQEKRNDAKWHIVRTQHFTQVVFQAQDRWWEVGGEDSCESNASEANFKVGIFPAKSYLLKPGGACDEHCNFTILMIFRLYFLERLGMYSFIIS